MLVFAVPPHPRLKEGGRGSPGGQSPSLEVPAVKPEVLVGDQIPLEGPAGMPFPPPPSPVTIVLPLLPCYGLTEVGRGGKFA